MNWPTVTERIRAARRHPKPERGLRQQFRLWRRRLGVFLAVLGPGLITSNVDNDAGGIATYSQAGAQFGYALLWTMLPLTVILYIGEEMCARMGVATGKGLSDLIREEFGFRSTFFVMLAGLVVDLGNTIAEFAGVAAGAGVFGVSKYIAVPIAALLVWVLVIMGSHRRVEKIFLAACAFYVAYVLSGFLAKPDWASALRQTVVPSFHFNTPYLIMLIGLVGTTVAPWQFFYLQAGEVEKRIGPRQYRHARTDVILGSVTSMAVVFFIIVCTGATLHKAGITNITDAGQAALALRPLAGRWAAGLFAFGLLNASLFSASVLPLSTAHVICEGLGFEAGLDQKMGEAPIFYGLYTGLIVVGAGIILIPNAPLFKILLLSQVANGVWLPIVLIFILLLINRKDLMGDLTNGPIFNFLAWTTSIAMIVVTLLWIFLSISPVGAIPGLLLLP
ncbi:MAG TPA: Nramp family divalent metal transporter [Candidatus Dormibacteraeota bacterium]|nr:Nramp family divalent metal transporter [Candidatus Dormibacteraeota bacterium]